MALPLRTDTPLRLVPLSWLLGRWEGAGVLGHPARGEDQRFGQVVEFGHDGRDFLTYTSTTWALDDDGATTEPLDVETGYWRPMPVDTDAPAPADGGPKPVELEVLLAHPTGIVEVLVGKAVGPRIDLTSDVVARTTTAHEYTAASRMYGLVEGDLLWALDVALAGHPLRSYASARLKRVA